MLLFIPFLALDDKGGVKGHLCTHLGMCRPCIPLFRTHVVLFTFWTSLILCKDYVVWETCIVCYSVFSYRTWVYSKKFLLVCDIFELWIICFLVFLCSGSERPDTPGYRPDSPWPESPDLYPESPGPADRYTFYWVDNLSYASHIFLALTYSPHCQTYKSLYVSLNIYANCWHVKSKLKFKVHGIHLGGALIC